MVKNRFLKTHSLFGGISDEEIAEIRKYLKSEHYPAGCDILSEGEVNDRIFFIVSGSVVVLKEYTEAGQERFGEIIRFVPGDTFGEMELIDIQPCAATVRTLEETEVLTFTNSDLYRLSHWNQKTFSLILMNLAREISRRLRLINEKFIYTIYREG